ncbi:MAG TPA: PQQ-binding-like beta-propeller repeat protein [Candidatus Sulfotelmatobacter sp.]|nr:PQQ-binding-like beta-propeller repeat protein [Candidatus Sulfotelmatobacter sp.]
MHLSSNVKKATVIISVLLMTSVMLIVTVQAQWYIDNNQYGMGWWGTNAKNLQPGGGQRLPAGVTPDMERKSDPYLSFRPNPVGVGQTILVNLWAVPGPSFVRYFTGYKVTFTKPDGTTDAVTIDSYRADSTAWFEYTVDQVGTWKIKFDMPGQYFPAGNYTMPAGTSQAGYTDSYTRSLYYKPASTPERTLIVQEAWVASWHEAPLPTDYWTRPIAPENREWWTIGGHFPWRGPSGGSTWDELYPDTYGYYTSNTGFFAGDNQRFTPWVQAPDSAHVAWKRKIQLSGIIGGDFGTYSITSGSGTPSIIYQGMAYQAVTKPVNGPAQSVLQCYDIRTGNIFWELPGAPAPTAIEYSEGLPAVPGATSSVGITPTLIAMSGNRLIKYNPATGAVSVNVSIPTWASITGFSTSVYYANGYVLSIQELNSTGGPGAYGTPTAGIYRLINWTTIGSSSDFKSRIISNISWPAAYFGDIADYGTGIGFRTAEVSWFDTPVTGFPYAYIPYDNASGIRYGTRIKALDLKTGKELWDKSFDETLYHSAASIAYNGKVAILAHDGGQSMGGGYYMVFDQYTGKLLYKSEQMDYPWDIAGFGAYSIASAYGMFFRFGYGGIYAFDWDTGKIIWKYTAPAFSEYETPYTDENGTTVYSWNAGGWIADGKLYAYNTEHTPSQPMTRGWGIHCINVTTGELIWKTKMVGSTGAVADGYLTVAGSDGNMYVYGKGKSITTVTAPDVVVSKGTGVVIKGSVLDQSPAQPNTPCVSKESMTTQMEYLHRQMPIDGLWHNETIIGVPVKLTAIASDASFTDIGTVITDGYYGTFSKSWIPPNEGDYQIIASFAGDDSYGSSGASTYVSIGPAQTSTDTGQQQTITVPDYTMTIIAAAIAVIIAVAVATMLLYRRK